MPSSPSSDPYLQTLSLVESTSDFLQALDAFQESYVASHASDSLLRALHLDWLSRFDRTPRLQRAYDRRQQSDASLREACRALTAADSDLRVCLVNYLYFWDSMESLDSRLALPGARQALDLSLARTAKAHPPVEAALSAP
jgi:hypothetical protein